MATEIKVKATRMGGGDFMVDISHEACAEFGVTHGEKITPSGCAGDKYVVGVGPTPTSKGELVLWCSPRAHSFDGLCYLTKKHLGIDD